MRNTYVHYDLISFFGSQLESHFCCGYKFISRQILGWKSWSDINWIFKRNVARYHQGGNLFAILLFFAQRRLGHPSWEKLHVLLFFHCVEMLSNVVSDFIEIDWRSKPKHFSDLVMVFFYFRVRVQVFKSFTLVSEKVRISIFILWLVGEGTRSQNKILISNHLTSFAKGWNPK